MVIFIQGHTQKYETGNKFDYHILSFEKNKYEDRRHNPKHIKILMSFFVFRKDFKYEDEKRVHKKEENI